MVRRFRPFQYYIDGRTYRIAVDADGNLTIRDMSNSTDIARLSKDVVTILTLLAAAYANPSIRLAGTETGARVYEFNESSGVLYLKNITDNTIEIDLDPANNLIRFLRRIFGEKEWFYESSSVSLTVGTKGNLGPESTLVDISNDPNYRNLLPIVALLTIGGTVGTSETVTIEVYAYDNAGNKYGPIMTYSKTGGTGSEYIAVDLSKLTVPTGNRLVKVTAAAKSSATSTNATASAQVWCKVT